MRSVFGGKPVFLGYDFEEGPVYATDDELILPRLRHLMVLERLALDDTF